MGALEVGVESAPMYTRESVYMRGIMTLHTTA